MTISCRRLVASQLVARRLVAETGSPSQLETTSDSSPKHCPVLVVRTSADSSPKHAIEADIADVRMYVRNVIICICIYNIHCMLYITLLLCFTAPFFTAGAPNEQDRTDLSRICFYLLFNSILKSSPFRFHCKLKLASRIKLEKLLYCSMWSCYERTLNGQQRTNNYCTPRRPTSAYRWSCKWIIPAFGG